MTFKKLVSLFDASKLSHNDNEWGFINENNADIKRIGYCVCLTPKAIEKTYKHKVELVLTR